MISFLSSSEIKMKKKEERHKKGLLCDEEEKQRVGKKTLELGNACSILYIFGKDLYFLSLEANKKQ